MKVLLILLVFVTCTSSTQTQVQSNLEYARIDSYREQNETVAVGKLFIDGCMYITVQNWKGVGITHAGNCPNQIHVK
jgi:hypothetical protein